MTKCFMNDENIIRLQRYVHPLSIFCILNFLGTTLVSKNLRKETFKLESDTVKNKRNNAIYCHCNRTFEMYFYDNTMLHT